MRLSRDDFNGAWHCTALIVLAPMAGHNWREWLERRETHLLVNALLYTAAVPFEAYNTWKHWGRPLMRGGGH